MNVKVFVGSIKNIAFIESDIYDWLTDTEEFADETNDRLNILSVSHAISDGIFTIVIFFDYIARKNH